MYLEQDPRRLEERPFDQVVLQPPAPATAASEVHLSPDQLTVEGGEQTCGSKNIGAIGSRVKFSRISRGTDGYAMGPTPWAFSDKPSAAGSRVHSFTSLVGYRLDLAPSDRGGRERMRYFIVWRPRHADNRPFVVDEIPGEDEDDVMC
jgi:hypothetical protein